MEALFLYFIKAGALIATFFCAYHFLLRKETFFNGNRWFLLFGLLASALLPLVTFKKIIWVAPAGDVRADWIEVPARAVTSQGIEVNWFWVAAWIYAIGIIIFFFRFVFDFKNLAKALKGKTVQQQADFKFIDVAERVSPFSYFNYIVYNSQMFSPEELENILEHEKVHCQQHHSIDVLVSRFFCIIFWYNPFVWLYRKAILQNLEFIADSEALKNIAENRGLDQQDFARKAYQITLLKVTTHESCVSISNHFYQSLIKKRIVMLNKNQSRKSNLWKYAVIVPALAAFLFYFQVKVIAQEKGSTAGSANVAEIADPVRITIDKNTTDAQLKEHAEQLKAQHGIKLRFSKVKRNGAGEITSIKADYKDKEGHKGTYAVSGDEAIKPMTIYRKENGSIGFGTGGKQFRIFKKSELTDSDHDAPEPAEPASPAIPAEPVEPEEPADVAFSFEMPDVDIDLDELDDLQNIVVKSIGKNGRVMVMVNGEVVDVDPDKVIADIDVEKIKEQARKSVIVARKQIEAARPQMEKARKEAQKARAHADIDREQAENAREEMEDARRQMEESRQALEEARRELEKSRESYERRKAQAKPKQSK